MKTKHTSWKAITAMTMVISGLLYAVAVFDPVSQPTVTLGEYTLKSRDLLDGPTKAYRSWFENGAWQGDLIEYDIPIDGTRFLNHTLVGSNDDAALIALAEDSTKNWLARATFLNKEEDITDYWKEETTGGRRLFTYNTSVQVAFLWDNLTAAQKISLDPATINDPDGDGDPADAVDPAASQNNNYFGPVFNFIRGDRSNETDQTDGFLRKRYSLLGDITNTPVYIGPPRELFTNFEGYSGFRYAYRNRDGVIATPANDGILHFFAEADGSEAYGYIPSMVIENLFRLAQPAYEHTYYLDSEMFVTSAQVNPDHFACVDSDDVDDNPINVSACEWRTVLTGGGGHGFEGLFALDISTPTYSSDSVLFEKSGGDFGHIYGAPRIATLGSAAEPDWYVFTGSGYKTACTGVNNADCDTDTSHPTALLMVSLADPSTVHKIDTLTTGGLSAPTLLSSDDTDLTVETAFAGDINGDLWIFRFDKTTPANSTFRKVFDGVPNLPISNTPAVVKHPDPDIGGYIVYFGTGSLFSLDDTLNDAVDSGGNSLYKQAIYGIHIKDSWVDGTDTSFDPLDNDDLQLQTLNPVDPEISVTFLNNGETKVVRTTPTNNPVNYSCAVDDSVCEAALFSGWRLEFPICGERLTGAPFVRAKRVQFVTTNPTGLDCGGRTVTGDSWMMSLDFLTGASANKVVFNLNGDTKLDILDTAAGVPPVGLSLGEGNIAQPVFVRLRDGIDKMFVNGLILPIPPVTAPGPLLFGHLDVVTDSPSGGVTAPNLIFKHSAGYQNNTSDGVSQTVDGLFHNYDTANGISYVDLYELEPRRGLANLAPTTDAEDASSGTCSTDPNNTRILVGDKCIEAVEAELNRSYDTITPTVTLEEPIVVDGEDTCPEDSEDRFGPTYRPIKDDAGAIEKCEKTIIDPESETYELGGSGSGLLDETKPFIVVLANVDLSMLGSLQIGCKVWEGGLNANGVNEFIQLQDHIAAELEAGVAAEDIRDPKYDEPVIFTLETIANNTDISGDPLSHVCPGNSPNPTLRVMFDEDAILREGVHGTRSQCVLGLHDPTVKVCYSDPEVLEAADGAVLDTKALIEIDDVYDNLSCATVPELPVPDRYIKDPALSLHVTAYSENGYSGYRWRNGALTVQLLDPAEMVLQDPDFLPSKGSGANISRIGGTFAQAFSIESFSGGDNEIVTFPKDSDGDESGLLYEAAIFWHYSDLADNIQRGDTASIPCYGSSNYDSALTQEQRGLTLGQYEEWADALEGTQILSDFAALLAIINNSNTSEAALNQALLELNELYNDAELGDILREYARYRDYVPGSVIPEQHLLDIDKNLGDGGNTNTSTADGVPADVITIETIDLESLGPNAVLGQRNWIDLRQ
jgi:hypothetical protein